MEFEPVLIVAVLIVMYSVVSRRLNDLSITGPFVFVAAGILLGRGGFGVLGGEFDQGAIEVLAEITLVLLLFTDATRIDLRALRSQIQLPARLLSVGLPLTVALGAGIAWLLLPGVSLWEAGLVGAVLAPTDAALGQAVVSDPRVPVRVRQALNVESGLNDGLMLPAITVILALAATEIDLETPGFWALFAVKQIGYGVASGAVLGAIGGRLLDHTVARGWVEGTFRQLATLSIGISAFSMAEVLGGNGFVAAFTAGIAFGFVARHECETAADFAEDEGQLFALVTFLFFGATLAGPALSDLTWQIGLYAVLSLTVTRMLPVALSLVALGLERRTIAFIGWFGPRGLASILFGISVLGQAELPNGPTIITVVTWTVLGSVVLHGLSSVPLTVRYAAWFGSMRDTAGMPEGVAVDAMRLRVQGGNKVTQRGQVA